MTELNEQQLARLARLGTRNPHPSPTTAARPAPWGPPSGRPVTATPLAAARSTQPTRRPPVTEQPTSVWLFGSRHRHVAAAGRILATGLATSGFLATIASIANADAQALEAKQADAPPPTTALQTIHRVLYVDEFGNPIAAPTSTSPLDTTTTAVTTTIAATTTVVDPTATVATVAPLVPPESPAPTPAATKPKAPSATAAPAAAAPPPPPAPEPAPTPAPAPAPTPAPAPPPTPAPTAAPAPAPTPAPAPPACQGSQC